MVDYETSINPLQKASVDRPLGPCKASWNSKHTLRVPSGSRKDLVYHDSQPPSDRDACFHDEILVRVDARNLLMLALIGHPASAVISMLENGSNDCRGKHL